MTPPQPHDNTQIRPHHIAFSVSGTVAEDNRFHDDRSLYTGVHLKGGPSTSDATAISLGGIF